MTMTSAAARRTGSAGMLATAGLLIGEEILTDASGGLADHIDPTTGLANGQYVLAGPSDVAVAAHTAKAAARSWGALTCDHRRRHLLEIARLLRSRSREFALLGALETGQPIGRAPVAERCADHFEYYAGWTDKIEGRVIPSYPGRSFDYTLLEPYGVIGAVMTWNAPMTIIGRKVAAALAAGNTIVVKSSELAPFSPFAFGQLCLEAGLPPGVVGVLCGDGRVGSTLVQHPDVSKVTFTGGLEAGRRIYNDSAGKLKPPVLELGGKSANIVFADADLEKAFRFAAERGVMHLSGQGCVLPTRLLVERSLLSQAAETLKRILSEVRIGDPLDEAVQMGPVISEGSADRIIGIVNRAVSDGDGSLLVGGGRVGGDLANGSFVEPTVFMDVPNDSWLGRTEVFGPVLAVTPFDSEEEAVWLANANPMGLAAYVHTTNLSRAHTVAATLQAGFVSVNGMNPMAPTTPFGGYKLSGSGYEAGYEGLSEFLRTKNVYIDLG